MNNYNELENCPICKNKFGKDDDVVVCPKCGAPYHRKCYNSLGHCLYEEKHNDNFSYKKVNTNKQGNNSNNNFKKCPRCLHDNPDNSLFCNNCGFPFTNAYTNSTSNDIPNVNIFNFDPLNGFNKEEKINDVTISELSNYVKSNSIYYIPVFKNIKDKNKSKFNFSAFLFSGGWFLYRKLYKIGIVLTSIVMLLMILSTFIEFTYAQEILSPLLRSAGISSTGDFSIDAYNNLINQFYLLPPEQKLILSLPSIIKFLNFIIMLVSGFIANKLYLKNCTTKIKKIKTLCKDDNNLYKEQINKYGGINFKIVPFLLICYIIIEYLPPFLI